MDHYTIKKLAAVLSALRPTFKALSKTNSPTLNVCSLFWELNFSVRCSECFFIRSFTSKCLISFGTGKFWVAISFTQSFHTRFVCKSDYKSVAMYPAVELNYHLWRARKTRHIQAIYSDWYYCTSWICLLYTSRCV